VKFRLIRERLIADGFATPDDFVAPDPVEIDDVLRVHTPEWAHGLRHGTIGYHEILRLEIPYSARMVDAFFLAAGGTLLASRHALQYGVGVNLSGGFHHAFPAHGEGFCALHDVAIAIRRLQHEGALQRAMIIDTDVHHGNGTAAIFANDESVFTYSIHQLANYPDRKPYSNVDVHLKDGTGDRDYLRMLERTLRPAIAGFRPQLILYVAGSDPYLEDKLGGLALTLDGLQTRDELVFSLARENKVPIAITLAGGYAMLVQDTVTIHANTVKAAFAP
jgi:acetoin utilization deacetylase AcuC-like enzyme